MWLRGVPTRLASGNLCHRGRVLSFAPTFLRMRRANKVKVRLGDFRKWRRDSAGGDAVCVGGHDST